MTPVSFGFRPLRCVRCRGTVADHTTPESCPSFVAPASLTLKIRSAILDRLVRLTRKD